MNQNQQVNYSCQYADVLPQSVEPKQTFPAHSTTSSRNIEFAMPGACHLPKDYAYFRSFYSRPAAYLSCEVSKYCDRMDHPGSFIYDEYPDKQTFQYHVNQIMEQFGAPKEELWLQPLIELLLVQEFLYRRGRKPER